MNKTTLTTIILDAAIILAVALFMFVIRPWDKADKVEADYGPADELTIAAQEDGGPVVPVVGDSEALDVEPVEGIRITAPANAMDKDREFIITAVDEKTWEEAKKRVEASGEGKMLFCFDLDAGLGPDEHLPGEYTFSMDLKKMGIPPILWDYISVWWCSGDERERYTTWIEDGKLVLQSDRNTLMEWVIGAPIVLPIALYVIDETRTEGGLLKRFNKRDDVCRLQLKNRYGDFDIYYCYKDTEYADRYEAWKSRVGEFEQRKAYLEKRADEEYDRQMKERYGEGAIGWLKSWQNTYSKEAIDRAAILAQLCDQDEKLWEIRELYSAPPSVADIGNMLIAANKYLTENQQLNPQYWTLDVYLVGYDELGATSGLVTDAYIKKRKVVVNYEKMLSARKVYEREGKGEAMLLTLTHELFHYRQHKWSFLWGTGIDYRTMETTAAYLENSAAVYYLQRGEIRTSPENLAKTLISGKFDGGSSDFDPAPRENYEVFGRDFNASINKLLEDSDWAANSSYTYADLMDYLHQKKGLEEHLKGKFLLEKYSMFETHKQLYMSWFGITAEKDFNAYVQGFCVDNLERIRKAQSDNNVMTVHPELHTKEYTVSPNSPVIDATAEKGNLIMRTFDLKGKGKEPFTAYIVRGKGCTAEEVSFYTSTGSFDDDKKEGLYFSAKNDNDYSGAYFKPHSSALPFIIVALFQPEKPVIKKVKKDYILFDIPKPESVLLKNKYVTGAKYIYRNANGEEMDIYAPASKFGKKNVKWKMEDADKSDFTLTVRWVCEKDGKVYESPESKEAVYGAKPVAPENKAEDSVKDKKPKEEKKAEEKEVKHDSQEKLVEEERYIENPFERISISTSSLPNGAVPECKVPIKITERRANAMDINAPNGLGRPSTYLTYDWKFTEENSEIKIASRGEGYLLSIKSTQTRSISNKSMSTWLRGSPDQTYDFNIELIFNEDLGLISGKVSQNTVFYMEIEPDYYVIEKDKHGDNVQRWKDDGKGLRWEKCTYEATYSFIVDNRDARHFSINDYSMKAITKEHERNSPNVATFEWSAGKEDLAASYKDVMISLDKKK